MEAQTFDQLVAEGFKAYKEIATEESKGKPITADMLSEEVKTAMGLEYLPEDIQNDILALSQKLVDYALVLAQGEEVKGPPPFLMGPSNFSIPSPFSHPSPFIDCMKQFPGRDLWRDTKDSMINTGIATGLGGVVPGWPAYVPFLTAGAGIANGVAGTLGYSIGCMIK